MICQCYKNAKTSGILWLGRGFCQVRASCGVHPFPLLSQSPNSKVHWGCVPVPCGASWPVLHKPQESSTGPILNSQEVASSRPWVTDVQSEQPDKIKMGGSINGETPQARWMVYKGKPHFLMDDDWGYPHFRTPPYGHTISHHAILSTRDGKVVCLNLLQHLPAAWAPSGTGHRSNGQAPEFATTSVGLRAILPGSSSDTSAAPWAPWDDLIGALGEHSLRGYVHSFCGGPSDK